jgi:RHS repeat-associated protein
VDVWLGLAAQPKGLLDPAKQPPSNVGVSDIQYDAHGRRTRAAFANAAVTTYGYDPDSLRLVSLYTRRGATFTADCDNPNPPPPTIAAPDGPLPGVTCGVQNLKYTYDPVGNITFKGDAAQPTLYFANRRVDPNASYTYDPLYRLTSASGREHLGQVAGAPIPSSYNDSPKVGLPHPNDGNALGTYLEQYQYDAVGNLLAVFHTGTTPKSPGWTRSFTYTEGSPLEEGKQSNRLTSTKVAATTETYSTGGDGYDASGNMLKMPQLSLMQWDFRDRLQMSQRQAVNGSDTDGQAHQGEQTWNVYDSSGVRVRKVTETSAGKLKEQRLYLGGIQLYRDGSGALERETLHALGEDAPFALVETRTQGTDSGPRQLARYQLRDLLGSSCVELDDQSQIISYEEYTPYGSTSSQCVRQAIAPKRYRYTGRERDIESGLAYHGARFYAPWLARWTSADPAELVDGLNGYSYSRCNSVVRRDPKGTESADANPAPPADEVRKKETARAAGAAGAGLQIGNKPGKTLVLDARTPDAKIAAHFQWMMEKELGRVKNTKPIRTSNLQRQAMKDFIRNNPQRPPGTDVGHLIDLSLDPTGTSPVAGYEDSHLNRSMGKRNQLLNRDAVAMSGQDVLAGKPHPEPFGGVATEATATHWSSSERLRGFLRAGGEYLHGLQVGTTVANWKFALLGSDRDERRAHLKEAVAQTVGFLPVGKLTIEGGTAGAILGTAIGGPIGGAIGMAVGATIGAMAGYELGYQVTKGVFSFVEQPFVRSAP